MPRPVDAQFPVTQDFGSYATAGVTADINGSEVQQLVAMYGNYQPYGHAGQDIGCPIGTPVHAIADGTVLWADWGTNLPGDESDWGYRQRWYLYKTFPGICTVIQHDGWKSVYAHQSSNDAVCAGQQVKAGQLIGYSGNTKAPGVTLGAHLHVEALVDDRYISGNGLIYGRTDPTPFYGSTSAQASSITPLEDDMPGADDRVFKDINGENCSMQDYFLSIDTELKGVLAQITGLKDLDGNPCRLQDYLLSLDTQLKAIGTLKAIDGSTVALADQLRSLDSKLTSVNPYIHDVAAAAVAQILAKIGAPVSVDPSVVSAAVSAAIAKAVNDDADARERARLAAA